MHSVCQENLHLKRQAAKAKFKGYDLKMIQPIHLNFDQNKCPIDIKIRHRMAKQPIRIQHNGVKNIKIRLFAKNV